MPIYLFVLVLSAVAVIYYAACFAIDKHERWPLSECFQSGDEVWVLWPIISSALFIILGICAFCIFYDASVERIERRVSVEAYIKHGELGSERHIYKEVEIAIEKGNLFLSWPLVDVAYEQETKRMLEDAIASKKRAELEGGSK